MKRRALTAKEVRARAARKVLHWAIEREADGDPEGSAIMRDLSRSIRTMRLTEDRP